MEEVALKYLRDDIEKMEQLLNDLKFLEKKTGLSTDKMTMISRNIYYLTWKINYRTLSQFYLVKILINQDFFFEALLMSQ